MKLLRLITAARRAGPIVFRRQGHDSHAPVGPPTTMDAMPVPYQSYRQVYGELQSKFNLYLACSFVAFALSLSYAFYEDVFLVEGLSKPQSYRNRNKQ
uniref:Deltameth_res domain-containing protein n=1 Tax=Strongyloides stercoralis TaxID=6248 RepID=A0A0K0E904_STRER